MKFSEVIKALEENPNKKFEKFQKYGNRYVISTRDNNYFQFDVFNEEGELLDSGRGAGGFSGNFKATDEDWQEVKQSVSYQKAFEKWVEGYTVYFIDKNGTKRTVDPLAFITFDYRISRNDIEMSTWFVED